MNQFFASDQARAKLYDEIIRSVEDRVPFFLVPVMPNLGAGPEDRDQLMHVIKQELEKHKISDVRLIVLDTLRRALPGKSENKIEDVSVLISHADYIAKAFQCLVVAVHHSPRSNDDRSSGSNGVDAAADVMIGVTRSEDGGPATAKVMYMKDGEENWECLYNVEPVPLGTDKNGNPISSAVLIPSVEPAGGGSGRSKICLTKAQQRVYEILLEAVDTLGVVGLAGAAAPPSMRAITREQAKQFSKKKGWWDASDDKADGISRTRWNARLNEIADEKAIGLVDQHLWIAKR